MTPWRTITLAVMAVCCAGLAVFFPLGVIAGHLCWPQFVVKGNP